MTLDQARRQFPHTWTEMIYLNHAAISPMSFRVREAVNNFLERRSLKGIESFPWAPKMAFETKKLIADRLNTTAERIAFTLNTSEGLNILAEGVQWQAEDRILLYKYEYPTNVYPFLNQSRKGVAIDFFDTSDGKITIEQIKEHVTPKTKLLSLSSVQFLDGYRSDLESIGNFCSANNILFSVDAIQGFPHIPIDVIQSKIDFLSCGSHKWLMSPEGLAFIYVSEKAQALIKQSSMGWTSVKNAFNHFDFDVSRIRDDAWRYENGAMPYHSIAALKSSLEFFGEFGYDQIYRRTLDHTGILIDQCLRNGAEVHTSQTEHERAGIVTLTVDDPEKTLKRLEDHHIMAAVRAGKLRISPYFYTTEEEVRKTVNLLFI